MRMNITLKRIDGRYVVTLNGEIAEFSKVEDAFKFIRFLREIEKRFKEKHDEQRKAD